MNWYKIHVLVVSPEDGILEIEEGFGNPQALVTFSCLVQLKQKSTLRSFDEECPLPHHLRSPRFLCVRKL